MIAQINDVLDFWFHELSAKDWWAKSETLDNQIHQRFGATLGAAKACELNTWRDSIEGRLAEIIVLDQFSRNIHRDTAQAFSQDTQALTLSQQAVALGDLEALNTDQQAFLLLPYMHSESAYIHQLAASLFQRPGLENNYEFELKHKAIIDRFGRYPHRNSILQRPSTEQELEFLKQPGSSF
jgi:uncharacterized protein (DUF924 family)